MKLRLKGTSRRWFHTVLAFLTESQVLLQAIAPPGVEHRSVPMALSSFRTKVALSSFRTKAST